MPNTDFDSRILVLSGPTASGKTAIALELAKALNGEIISADSMQVYKHLSIGTAKPTPEEVGNVPYHLIDHVEPDDQYHLGRFIKEASSLLSEIQSRGRQPIVCGGTGLYIRGLLYGVFPGGEPNSNLRKRLETRLDTEGLPVLFKELKQVDPPLAILYGPNDKQRIIRALEFYHSTGKPLSSMHQQNWETPLIPHSLYVLSRPRSELYNIINSRVDRMVDTGLFAEVKKYIANGWSKDNPAVKALGYRDLISALKGEMPFETALDSMKQKSRNYAKRQETWFRSMKNLKTVSVANQPAEQLAQQIMSDWKNMSVDVYS